MKRFALITLLLSFVVGLSACSQSDSSRTPTVAKAAMTPAPKVAPVAPGGGLTPPAPSEQDIRLIQERLQKEMAERGAAGTPK